jgi:nitrogen fixation protein NifU and related proteins
MDLAELYRDVIVDHNRRPRNRGPLPSANHRAEGNNPLCGDQLRVYVDVEDDVIRDLRFEGTGCAISTASASLMSEAVKGRSRAEATALFEAVHRMLTGSGNATGVELGKLAALAGVREFPARVKCASLCWHTLNAALADAAQPVTTE